MSEAGYYSEDAATFGDRVAAARDAVGLTQNELAARLGIKISTLRGWENDTAEPRANKLQMLAGVLNVSMRWLLTGEGEGVESPDVDTVDKDLTLLLAEMRKARVEAAGLAEHIGRLEKRLRLAIRDRG